MKKRLILTTHDATSLNSRSTPSRTLLMSTSHSQRLLVVPLAYALKHPEQRQNAVSIKIAAKLMWAELMIRSDKRVNYLMASSVQNGPKTMFFKDYSLLVVFDAYLRSKCTIPDIYTCNCAGLVVIHSHRTALGLFKEERKKKERRR